MTASCATYGLGELGRTSTDKLSPERASHRVLFSWQSNKLPGAKPPKGWKYNAPRAVIDKWWQDIGKDRRTAYKIRYAAIMDYAPKTMTDDQKNAWWGQLPKKRRIDIRDKYEKDFFDDVGSVIKDVAKVASKAVDVVTLQPITKHIPIIKDISKATTTLYKLPISAVSQLASGKRIDQVAVSQFKSALSSAKTLAPYVQTVISFVPGIGTGLSAGIGGALALASGKRIDEAFIEAMRSAVPGGAIAKAAFDVASSVAQGKPVDAVLLNALPVAPAAKEALVRGVSAAKGLAEGKRVDQILIDQALKALPPAAQKAAQVGLAVAQAKNIQQGLSKAGGAAAKAYGGEVAKVIKAPIAAQAMRAVKTAAAQKKVVPTKVSADVARAVRLATKGIKLPMTAVKKPMPAVKKPMPVAQRRPAPAPVRRAPTPVRRPAPVVRKAAPPTRYAAPAPGVQSEIEKLRRMLEQTQQLVRSQQQPQPQYAPPQPQYIPVPQYMPFPLPPTQYGPVYQPPPQLGPPVYSPEWQAMIAAQLRNQAAYMQANPAAPPGPGPTPIPESIEQQLYSTRNAPTLSFDSEV